MSMEEILASIRKIISEDKKKPSPGPRPRDWSPASSPPAASSAVLDLNQQIQEDGSIRLLDSESAKEMALSEKNLQESVHHSPTRMRPMAPSAVGSPSYSPGAARTSPVLPTVPSASARSTSSVASSTSPSHPSSIARGSDEELLMSKNTAAASLENLQRVMHNKRVLISQENPQTLEDMVQEALKPLLRTWMDTHLPGLVEKVVREQIQLLSREA